jgi:hypothetical protein
MTEDKGVRYAKNKLWIAFRRHYRKINKKKKIPQEYIDYFHQLTHEAIGWDWKEKKR